MNDLEKKSIECIKNMPIAETTYQVARNVVLDYITNLQERFDALLEAHKIADELETEYQERNEKAIEYMNNYIKVEESNEPVKIEFKVVRSILQGEDKDDR